MSIGQVFIFLVLSTHWQLVLLSLFKIFSATFKRKMELQSVLCE